jgi:hypothetical protein
LLQLTDFGGSGCSQVMEAFSATVSVSATEKIAVWHIFQSGCLVETPPAFRSSAREAASVTQGSLTAPSMVQLAF